MTDKINGPRLSDFRSNDKDLIRAACAAGLPYFLVYRTLLNVSVVHAVTVTPWQAHELAQGASDYIVASFPPVLTEETQSELW